MRIAIINEVSAADKNRDIMSALEGRDHEFFNIGMKTKEDRPELTYINTGLLAAILLNLKRVDFVIGGCGTGQGFLNSVMQYPEVFCGHIVSALDAWLFGQINAGNCISLALNQGYGWAGEINLRYIFDRLFSDRFGSGYPPERKDSQAESRKVLANISQISHQKLDYIIENIDNSIIRPVLDFPGILDFLDIDNLDDPALKKVLNSRIS
ncbi:MAG: RpiB/LacA/LacB family sugar-phosphate isomerase [Actinobacteria bacterium]|nr:RpiB/LacA/LacB family sugar-phosphate isomerase [Actinomycetota bacterium]